MYWPQKVGRGVYFLLRCTKNMGGRGNPFSAIGANAFRTTNSQSRSAMRGAEFHGNSRRDGQPAYRVYTAAACGSGCGDPFEHIGNNYYWVTSIYVQMGRRTPLPHAAAVYMEKALYAASSHLFRVPKARFTSYQRPPLAVGRTLAAPDHPLGSHTRRVIANFSPLSETKGLKPIFH